MKIKMLAICLNVLWLAACSSSQDVLLPTNGTTMLDMWHQGSGQATLTQSRSGLTRRIDPPKGISTKEMKSYTRTAENEANNLFPRLPNPDLIMYVFPHLSDNEEPVPISGYSTVIPFYGRTQYAQPGERTRPY